MDLETIKSFLQPIFPVTVVMRPVTIMAAVLLVCSINGHLCSAAASEGAYKIIKSLEGLGNTPCALVAGKNGRLYGALEAGGAKGAGVVVGLNKDGTAYTPLHSFTGD